MITPAHKLLSALERGQLVPLDLDVRAADLAPDRWAELVRERRNWFWSQGYPLMQRLERFLQDAPALAAALGYPDSAALLREGYGLDLILNDSFLRGLKSAGGLRPCVCCGEVFSARRRDARYCSSTCRSRETRRRRRS